MFQFIKDQVNYCFIHDSKQIKSDHYTIENDHVKNFDFNLEKLKTFAIRSSLMDTLNDILSKRLQIDRDIEPNCVNILDGLVLEKNIYDLELNNKIELNNIRYDILFFIKSTPNLQESSKLATFKNELLKYIKNNLERDELIEERDINNNQIHNIYLRYNKQNRLLQILETENETIIQLNCSLLLKIIFKLEDERLMHSNDRRVYEISENNIGLSWRIKPYSIEPLKWIHDLSFWIDSESFDYNEFLDTIRSSCLGLVHHAQLIDVFKSDDFHTRTSYCFRLTYESCDRALSWNQTTEIQYGLRDDLIKINGLSMR